MVVRIGERMKYVGTRCPAIRKNAPCKVVSLPSDLQAERPLLEVEFEGQGHMQICVFWDELEPDPDLSGLPVPIQNMLGRCTSSDIERSDIIFGLFDGGLHVVKNRYGDLTIDGIPAGTFHNVLVVRPFAPEVPE